MSAVMKANSPRVLARTRATTRIFAPIRLRTTLVQHCISHIDLASAVKQANGRPLSRPALSFLMNYAEWPASTTKESIREQVERYLEGRGVPPEELHQIWKPDEEAQITLNERNAHGHHAYPRRGAVPIEELIDIPEKEMLSPAARKHFQIFRDPFIEEIRGPDDIYLAADQRYIREAMYQTARNGGFIAVIGESGAGKTTLRLDLIERVTKENLQLLFIQPRVIDKSRLTARMVCEAVLSDLAPGESQPHSLERITRKVEKTLVESHKAGNRHVLMIEEAQDLEPRALKHLKRFYEIQLGYAKLLSIILVGQPELRTLLNEKYHPELREVIRRCEIAELQPLDGNVREYLSLKFERAGKQVGDVFADDAFAAIVTRLSDTRGREVVSAVYPLAVNNLVTRAMNLAASMGEARISAEVVKEL
jgi:type II secretory pathway predicted ATPase ExeA